MTIKAYVTTTNSQDAESIKTDEGEFLSTLDSQEENVAVKIQELFSSVAKSVSEHIEVESQLTIEINGSINMKAQGGINYLFFNAGAGMEASGGMKVTFKTTLRPAS